METKEIILQLITDVGLNAKQFAESIGATPTQIYDLQSGKIKKITDRMADKILSRYNRYSRLWLLTGEGPKYRDLPYHEVSNLISESVISRTENEMKFLSPALDSMSVGWLPDNGIIERIKNVIINKGLTEEEFAHAINVPESALKEVFLRGIQSDIIVLVSIIKTYKDISAKWLLTGLGDMGDYKVPVLPKEIYYEKNVDVYDYVKKNAKNIRYSSVIKQFSKYNLVYEVSGDWMLPDFKPGDMLALVEVPENAPIMNGSPYVIDTMSTGLIFRLIYQQEDGLLCRSFNDDRFAPFSIARDDIYNIYRVIGMLRTNV